MVSPANVVRSAFGRGKGLREGEAPSVDGRLLYAIGDVHGRYDLMKALLASLAKDYARRAKGRRPLIVFLGDYVDRGPESAQSLEALLWLQRRPELEVHALRGNHEQALLEFIDAPETGGPWLRYGGAATLASYGVEPPRLEDEPEALLRARDELLERMPASHLRLLQSLELMLVVGDYAFVHAGVRPGAGLEAQEEEDLLWIRQEFLAAPGPFEKVIVHGHSWVDERPTLLPHRVGVDTGAYATGVLTAICFDDREVSVLQTAGERAAA
jgi:serine/threonine protein phosphatase 1